MSMKPASLRRPVSSGEPIHQFTAGPFRVNYSNTDRMGHAYHAEYLVWFESARTELLRSLGRTYREWEDDEGVFLPVTECSVRFRQSAHYDDLLMVETTVTHLSRASITFDYRLFRQGDGAALATGSTTHAFVNASGRVVRVADRLLPGLFGAEKS